MDFINNLFNLANSQLVLIITLLIIVVAILIIFTWLKGITQASFQKLRKKKVISSVKKEIILYFVKIVLACIILFGLIWIVSLFIS